MKSISRLFAAGGFVGVAAIILPANAQETQECKGGPEHSSIFKILQDNQGGHSIVFNTVSCHSDETFSPVLRRDGVVFVSKQSITAGKHNEDFSADEQGKLKGILTKLSISENFTPEEVSYLAAYNKPLDGEEVAGDICPVGYKILGVQPGQAEDGIELNSVFVEIIRQSSEPKGMHCLKTNEEISLNTFMFNSDYYIRSLGREGAVDVFQQFLPKTGNGLTLSK